MTSPEGKIVDSNSTEISVSSAARPPEICVKSKKRKKYAKRDLITFIGNLLLIWCIIDTLLLDEIFASSSPKSPVRLTQHKQGKACDKSRIVLSEDRGFISTGPEFSNYTQNSHCEWLIKPLLSRHTKNGSHQAKDENILSDLLSAGIAYFILLMYTSNHNSVIFIIIQ